MWYKGCFRLHVVIFFIYMMCIIDFLLSEEVKRCYSYSYGKIFSTSNLVALQCSIPLCNIFFYTLIILPEALCIGIYNVHNYIANFDAK